MAKKPVAKCCADKLLKEIVGDKAYAQKACKDAIADIKKGGKKPTCRSAVEMAKYNAGLGSML